MFFTLAVAGFGLLLVWRVRQFLGVSVPNKLRKIQLSKKKFLRPGQSHIKNFEGPRYEETIGTYVIWYYGVRYGVVEQIP